MIKITPGQALLRLLKLTSAASPGYTTLARLFLEGVGSEEDRVRLNSYLAAPELAEFEISFDIEAIHDDPSRRYFETQLARETLIHSSKLIDETLIDNLKKQLSALIPERIHKQIDSAIERKAFDATIILNEEGRRISRDLVRNYVFSLSELDYPACEATKNIAKNINRCALLAVALVSMIGSSHFPLDIFNQGFFSEEARGLSSKKGNDHTCSNKLGILKSYHPLSVADVAYSDEKSKFNRSPERSSPIKASRWVKFQDRTLIHPFVNAISGTMLAQIRAFVFFIRQGCFPFTTAEQLFLYLKLFSATLLFAQGGHSLFEFFAVLKLPEVQEEFAKLFPEFNEVSLCSLFMKSQETAFEQSLAKAIEYNEALISRKKLNTEIKSEERAAAGYSAEGNYFLFDLHCQKAITVLSLHLESLSVSNTFLNLFRSRQSHINKQTTISVVTKLRTMFAKVRRNTRLKDSEAITRKSLTCFSRRELSAAIIPGSMLSINFIAIFRQDALISIANLLNDNLDRLDFYLALGANIESSKWYLDTSCPLNQVRAQPSLHESQCFAHRAKI